MSFIGDALSRLSKSLGDAYEKYETQKQLNEDIAAFLERKDADLSPEIKAALAAAKAIDDRYPLSGDPAKTIRVMNDLANLDRRADRLNGLDEQTRRFMDQQLGTPGLFAPNRESAGGTPWVAP